MRLWGFEIKKTEDDIDEIPTISASTNFDGAINVGAALGGSYSSVFNMEGILKTESELVTKYRQMALQPEIRTAVEAITNEAICVDTGERVVNIILDEIEVGDNTKKKIYEEFDTVLRLLDFSNNAYELFRTWYVDGRINFNVIINDNDPKSGIKLVQYIDPRKLRLIKEFDEVQDPQVQGLTLKKLKNEYYIYSDVGFGDMGSTSTSGMYAPYSTISNNYNSARIAKDSIVRVTSGLVTEDNSMVISYLHSSIKPLNLLKSLEDANVIYTLTRAPQRRVFYIDVGTLPTAKAEQYLYDMMQRHKNKLTYDPATGKINDDRRFMTMTEDFWFPRREGCLALGEKVALLDGRTVELGQLIVEYKQGKQNWTYSVSPEGKIVPGKISWAGVTRTNTEVVDVHLDNGKIITATPDHKFILRNGEKIEAKDLAAGSSLMPFNTRDNLQIQHNDTGNWENSHDMVARETQDDTICVLDDKVDEYENEWNKLKQERDYNTKMPTTINSLKYDPTVTKVAFREDRIDVGTLTIDDEHEYHDYHNFALDSGIFVMNSRSTEIDVIEGAGSLTDNEQLDYFQKNLYKSLNIPLSRLESETQYNFGRVNEMSREEVNFGKFVRRLRARFSMLFDELLQRQLILKGIITPDEWPLIVDHIRYDFMKDNFFEELKQMEIIRERISLYDSMQNLIGKDFSMGWAYRNILFMSKDQMETMRNEIEEERKLGYYDDMQDYSDEGNDEAKKLLTQLAGEEETPPPEE